MSISKSKAPRNLNEWRQVNLDYKVTPNFSRYSNKNNTVFAKYTKVGFFCPWCGAQAETVERYNFTELAYDFAFTGCSRFPLCDWTSTYDSPIVKKPIEHS